MLKGISSIDTLTAEFSRFATNVYPQMKLQYDHTFLRHIVADASDLGDLDVRCVMLSRCVSSVFDSYAEVFSFLKSALLLVSGFKADQIASEFDRVLGGNADPLSRFALSRIPYRCRTPNDWHKFQDSWNRVVNDYNQILHDPRARGFAPFLEPFVNHSQSLAEYEDVSKSILAILRRHPDAVRRNVREKPWCFLYYANIVLPDLEVGIQVCLELKKHQIRYDHFAHEAGDLHSFEAEDLKRLIREATGLIRGGHQFRVQVNSEVSHCEYGDDGTEYGRWSRTVIDKAQEVLIKAV